MGRILLVGEDNPYGSNPRHALFPLPPNAAGGRLMRHLGLRRATYLGERVRRINLCQGKWDGTEARARTRGIKFFDASSYDAVVILGAKVRDAFGFNDRDFFEAFTTVHPGNGATSNYVVLPHPSGRSRPWNDPEARQKARDLLARFSDLPFGEVDE